MPTELSVGDTVQLVAPSVITAEGNLLAEGARGMVVGFKGFGEVVVSWETGWGLNEHSVVSRADVVLRARPPSKR